MQNLLVLLTYTDSEIFANFKVFFQGGAKFFLKFLAIYFFSLGIIVFSFHTVIFFINSAKHK